MSLKIKNICKSFDKRKIFENFSLELPDKRVFLLSGESGVGKTTLLRMISGLDTKFSGEISGGGVKNCSIAFQEYRLFPELSALNNVILANYDKKTAENEKEARTIAEAFVAQSKEQLIADTKARLSLDGLFSQIQAGNIKELNIIVKADVQGSVEAVKQSLVKLSNEEVAVRVIHGGVGAINESDVTLASASNAIIIGFNVKPDNTAKETAEREKVDLRLYRVIYQAIEDIEAAMKGMLDPEYEEKIIGHAEVRQTFKASGVGVIAGSYVMDGKIVRGCKARITREGTQIYDGPLASLKRFKDDVKEVATGYECGLVFEKFNDLQEFDQVELYMMVEVPRK